MHVSYGASLNYDKRGRLDGCLFELLLVQYS